METLLSSREHTGWVRATAVADEHSCCSIGCNRLLAWRLPGGPPPDLPERELPLYEDATAADQAAQRSHDILSIGWRDGVLAAGSVDGALRCWRADVVGATTGPAALLGCRPAHWTAHADRVAAVALSAEGALLSAGYDRLVRAWRAPDSAELGAAWQLSREARLPAGRPTALAVGGARVHCGTSDGEVRSLDAASLELASAPMRVTQGARATAVAVLGTNTMTGTLVAGDSAGMLHLGHEP